MNRILTLLASLLVVAPALRTVLRQPAKERDWKALHRIRFDILVRRGW